MERHYFATVGLHTKETILMGVRRFRCNHVTLFTTEDSRATAIEIKDELIKYKTKFGIDIKEENIKINDKINLYSLWGSVKTILDVIMNVLTELVDQKSSKIKCKKDVDLRIIFDISGGNRLMSLAALVAASLVKIDDIYYIFPRETLNGEKEYIEIKVPPLRLNPFSKAKEIILEILKEKKREKKAVIGLAHIGKLIGKKANISRRINRLSEHISELVSYGLIKKEKSIRTGKAFIYEITNEGIAYLCCIKKLKTIRKCLKKSQENKK